MKLKDKIAELEIKIARLEAKQIDLSRNTEEKPPTAYSVVGNAESKAALHPSDIVSGVGAYMGSFVLWNEIDMSRPAYGTQVTLEPKKGYNRHTHSRYSGGALIINGLELAEYKSDGLKNIHNQQFWKTEPALEIVKNSAGEEVEKIGTLDISFNPDTKKWGTSSSEIDVEQTYLVKKVTKEIPASGVNPKQLVGAIQKDDLGNEMKAPLLYTAGDEDDLAGRNENLQKSQVYWDKYSKCWRFFAAFKPGIEVE